MPLLERSKLYKDVWSRPCTKIAAELGISSSALHLESAIVFYFSTQRRKGPEVAKGRKGTQSRMSDSEFLMMPNKTGEWQGG